MAGTDSTLQPGWWRKALRVWLLVWGFQAVAVAALYFIVVSVVPDLRVRLFWPLATIVLVIFPAGCATWMVAFPYMMRVWNPQPATPPGWYADPWNAHQLRYWNGGKWTGFEQDRLAQETSLKPPAGPAQQAHSADGHQV